MRTLQFATTIHAPVARVWEQMLNPEPFKVWAGEFMPGSHYVGSWEEGASIRFLGPDGSGMSSVIETNKLHETISIRHIGLIQDGLEDTTSEEVKAMTPAWEKYYFYELDGMTTLKVEMDTTEQYEDCFLEGWPKALARLKEISEAAETE